MTFLELCVKARRNCGIAGSGPTSVLNQTGEIARLVGWVADEYTLLQQEETNWRWLRGNFTLQTVAGLDKYTYSHANMTDADTAAAISRFARWWDEEFQIYLTSAGIGTQTYLPYSRWENFRASWLLGTVTNQYPSEASIDPQNRVRLGAPPDGIYTFTGEYQKGPQTLAADGDTPEMPSRFHDIIVARAMKRFAGFNAAPEVWAEADRIESTLMPLMRIDQLPEPRVGGNPLA